MVPIKLLEKNSITANTTAKQTIFVDNLLNNKQKIPVFKLKNKNTFDFVDDTANSVTVTSNLQVPLNDINSPIFATFGQKDPRFYIALHIKNEQILALVDSGSTKIIWEIPQQNL